MSRNDTSSWRSCGKPGPGELVAPRAPASAHAVERPRADVATAAGARSGGGEELGVRAAEFTIRAGRLCLGEDRDRDAGRAGDRVRGRHREYVVGRRLEAGISTGPAR